MPVAEDRAGCRCRGVALTVTPSMVAVIYFTTGHALHTATPNTYNTEHVLLAGIHSPKWTSQ